jgi:hypothetical protein
MNDYDKAYPQTLPKGYAGIARLAVEFDCQVWREEHEDLFQKPLAGYYWTVRLGRLALCKDGTWTFFTRLRDEHGKRIIAHVRKQRFETLEEAIEIATKVFGKTPEDGVYKRSLYK